MIAIGIDLGTTNSVAAIGGKDLRILPEPGGEHLTPSVVGILRSRAKPAGEIVVGRLAVNNAKAEPLNTIFSIKRLMGLVYGDEHLGKAYGSHGVGDVENRARLRIAPAPPAEEGEPGGVRVQLGDKTYTPVEISSMILKQLRAHAELALGAKVTHAVITVPAYFEERQRKSTEEAGELAGFKVLRIIDEPTAAAIAFGVNRETERHRVLVYDLGGGTFDISIIQMSKGIYQVLGIQGDNWLGGDDFDAAIVSRMIDWVRETYGGFDPSEDMIFMTRAKEIAKSVKVRLSSLESVDIYELFLTKTPSGQPVDVDMTVQRAEFDADIAPLVERTIALVEDALQAQSLSPEDISEVLLVGGSTAVPSVQKRVADVFGNDKLRRHLNPMECVALGAAIFAERCEIKPDGSADTAVADRPITQVTAMHFGVAATKGKSSNTFVPIIEKGTPLPLINPRIRTFFPLIEGQKIFRIPVFEGLNELANLNQQQGVVEIPLDTGVGIDTPIDISFSYDGNKTLVISVKIGDRAPRVETLRRDLGRARSADSERLVDDWREELDPNLRMSQHFLDSYGEFMESEDRTTMKQEISDGRAAIQAQDKDKGSQISQVLAHHVLSCGVASQLFVAEHVSARFPYAAGDIVYAAANLRQGIRGGQPKDTIDTLAAILRTLVAQARSSRVERVEDRKWDGLRLPT